MNGSESASETLFEQTFRENFESRGEIGAAVSVWQDGVEIAAYSAGTLSRNEDADRWGDDTLVPVYSATKGPSAAVVLLALYEHGLTPETKVAEVWPALAKGGRIDLSFGQLLSHQGGWAALDTKVDIQNYDEVIQAIELQAPNWVIGSGHGYHPRTFGFLLEEIVRRLCDGRTLGSEWRRRVADRIACDFWIGLPEREHTRVARLSPAKLVSGQEDDVFYKAFADPGSLTRRAFSSPSGLRAVSEMNAPSAWTGGFPAMGGVGSARGLAKFYGMLANGGRWNGETIVPDVVLGWMEGRQTSGDDKVILYPTSFSAGFMMDMPGRGRRGDFGGSERAFGHPGAGGSHAFAHPERRIGFAYVMNQMERSVLPGEKACALVGALARL